MVVLERDGPSWDIFRMKHTSPEPTAVAGTITLQKYFPGHMSANAWGGPPSVLANHIPTWSTAVRNTCPSNPRADRIGLLKPQEHLARAAGEHRQHLPAHAP